LGEIIMSIRYQMNKTSMQKLQKELKARSEALPTLKAKETALRTEVKKAKDKLEELTLFKEQLFKEQSKNYKIWMEYSSVLTIGDVDIELKNIAGVKVPKLKEINFIVRDHSLFAQRAWIPSGTDALKKMAKAHIELELMEKEMHILYRARKKTTQKVNLYEKVQIPQFKEAIGKIKRFLEDEENLSRAGQKIIKAKQEREFQEKMKGEAA
jgi:V/A-type H+/Na+-transporting ATPase subunit D